MSGQSLMGGPMGISKVCLALLVTGVLGLGCGGGSSSGSNGGTPTPTPTPSPGGPLTPEPPSFTDWTDLSQFLVVSDGTRSLGDYP
jgi:hypothetical protein